MCAELQSIGMFNQGIYHQHLKKAVVVWKRNTYTAYSGISLTLPTILLYKTEVDPQASSNLTILSHEAKMRSDKAKPLLNR